MKSHKKNKTNEYKRTTVLIKPETFKKLKLFAVSNEKSLGDCMEEAILAYLKAHKKA